MAERKKILCKVCGKMISEANIVKHQKTKKCKQYSVKNHDDKTAGNIAYTIAPSKQEAVHGLPASVPAESHVLTEINLKGEFDKMVTKLNPKKQTDNDDVKQCGSCGKKFSELIDGKCPYCGIELEEA